MADYQITDEIFTQFEKVRQSGKTNMLDSGAVQYHAFHDWNGYELVTFIENGKYGDILKGYSEWAENNPEVIENIRKEIEEYTGLFDEDEEGYY